MLMQIAFESTKEWGWIEDRSFYLTIYQSKSELKVIKAVDIHDCGDQQLYLIVVVHWWEADWTVDQLSLQHLQS